MIAGQYRFGRPIGKALQVSETQVVTGRILNGFVEGSTTEIGSEQAYKGGFSSGVRSGQGEVSYADGSRSEGEF